MKIENQVCTLEQAKRLKELGVSQESYFVIGEKAGTVTEGWSVEGNEDTFYAAFNVAELGVMLPNKETPPKRSHDNQYWYDVLGGKFCTYESEAEARAALLIFRLKKGITTTEEVNQRLQAD